MSPLRKSAIETSVHASVGSEQTTDTFVGRLRPSSPNCQSSAVSVIVRAGVPGPKSIRKRKRAGPKQTSLRWVCVSADVTDILDGWPLPLPPCSPVSAADSDLWMAWRSPTDPYNIDTTAIWDFGGGVLVSRSELSHLCLNGILIFFIWMFSFRCVVVFVHPPFCSHPSLRLCPLQTPQPLTFSQQVLFCLIPEKVTFGSIGSGE